jgi:hypothetical protein
MLARVGFLLPVYYLIENNSRATHSIATRISPMLLSVYQLELICFTTVALSKHLSCSAQNVNENV